VWGGSPSYIINILVLFDRNHENFIRIYFISLSSSYCVTTVHQPPERVPSQYLMLCYTVPSIHPFIINLSPPSAHILTPIPRPPSSRTPTIITNKLLIPLRPKTRPPTIPTLQILLLAQPLSLRTSLLKAHLTTQRAHNTILPLQLHEAIRLQQPRRPRNGSRLRGVVRAVPVHVGLLPLEHERVVFVHGERGVFALGGAGGWNGGYVRSGVFFCGVTGDKVRWVFVFCWLFGGRLIEGVPGGGR
jgi:hypothetical protein